MKISGFYLCQDKLECNSSNFSISFAAGELVPLCQMKNRHWLSSNQLFLKLIKKTVSVKLPLVRMAAKPAS